MRKLTNLEVETVSGALFDTTAGNIGAAVGASIGAAAGGYCAFYLSILALGFGRTDWPALGVAAAVLTGGVAAGTGIGGIIGTGIGGLFNHVST